MKNLEDAIRNAVARGEFVHLSCISNGKGFSATFASASRGGGYSFAEGKDPIQAMTAAINATPMRRRTTVVDPGGHGSSQACAVHDDEALG